MKMKKIMAVCLALMLAFGSMASLIPAFAEESAALNLEAMKKIALEENSDMKILSIQLERNEDDYSTAKAIAVSLRTNFDIDDSITYENKVDMELTPLTAEKSLLDKRFEVMQKENEVTYKVTDLYFSYFNLSEDLRSKREYYDFMEEKKDAKDVELKLGQITQLAYDQFMKTYKSSFIDYAKAKNAFDMKKRELNVFLGQDPLTSIEPVKQDQAQVSVLNYDMEVLSAQITENSYQIYALELAKAIKEEELTLKQRFKGFGEVAIEMALLEDQIIELENQINDVKRSLKFELYSKYNEALIALEDISLKQLEYDLAKRSYDIDKLKYDNGLISVIDLTESRKAFEEAYFNINDAKLIKHLVVQSFLDFVEENTTPLTVR